MVIFFKEIGKNKIYSLSPPNLFLWSALGSRKISTTNQNNYEKILWRGVFDTKKTHLVNWNTICTSRSEGSLGIKNLWIMNKALLGKVIWQCYENPNSLWSQDLCSKYLDALYPTRLFTIDNSPISSMIWNSLRKSHPSMLPFLKWDVGIGNNINF